MPLYEVDIPGRGRFRINSPTELTDQQVYAAVLQAQQPAPTPAPTPAEPTLGGQIKEAFKGLIPGAIGLGESAAVGASALLPEEQEQAVRQYVKEAAAGLRKPFEAAPGYEDTVARKLGQAVGSTIPFFALGPLGVPGRIAATGLGVSAGAGEARVGAEEGGATAEQRAQATLMGAPVGAFDLLAPAIGPLKSIITTALARGGIEGATEAAQKVAQNMIAKGVYNPEQEIIAGAGEEGAYGFGAGALTSAIIDLTIGRKARAAALGQEPAEQPPQAPSAITPPETPPVTPTGALEQQLAAEEPVIPEPTLRGIRETVRAPQEAPPQEAAPELTPFQQYAADRIAAAQSSVEKPTNKDYLEYLLQDPAMARQLVEQRVAIPGFPRQRSEGLLGALELQLKRLEKEGRKAGATGTVAAQQRLQGLESQEQDALEAQRFAEEQARREAEEAASEAAREVRIAPELAGLRRLGKPSEKTPQFSAWADQAFRKLVQRGLDEKQVDDLINTLPLGESYTPLGQVVYGAGTSPERTVNELRSSLAIARLFRDRQAAKEIVDELRNMKVRERGATGALTAEGAKPLQQAIGIRKPDNLQAETKADQFADQQNQLFVELANTLEFGSRRPSGTLGLDTAAQQNMQNSVQTLRNKFLEAHLAELAARKEAFGLGPVKDWERGAAQARANSALNELINRWGSFTTPTADIRELKGRVRRNLTNILNSAIDRDQQRQKAEIAEKTGTPKTTYYFEDQAGQRIPGKTMEVPAERGPRAVVDELKLREQPRIPADERQAAMGMLDQVLRTADRRTRARPTEEKKAPEKVKDLGAMQQLFEKPVPGGVAEKLSPDTLAFAERLRTELETNTDPEFAQRAREQAQRIMEGNLPNEGEVRELDEIISERAKAAQSQTRPGATPEELQRTSAQPQLSLFGEVATERATPANFQRLLDSKDVAGLRARIAQIKADNKAALEQARRFTKDVREQLAQAQQELQKARQRLQELREGIGEDKVTYRGKKRKFEEGRTDFGTDIFAVNKAGEPEWFAPAVRKVVELESAIASIPLRINALKDIQKQLRGLDKQARQDLLQMAQAARDQDLIEVLSMKRGGLSAEIADLVATVNDAKANVGSARKRLESLMTEWNKGAVIREALVRERQKAERRVERAETKARAAQAAVSKEEKAEAAAQAAEAEKLVTPEAKWRASLQRGREGLNLPGLRVEKDTSGMNKEIAEIRSAMGSLDEQLQEATDPAKRAEIEAKLEEQREKLETVYARAPRITTELKQKEQLAFEEAFDNAQKGAFDAAAARRRKRTGEMAPALPPARFGPLVASTKTRAKKQTGKKKDITVRADDALQNLIDARNNYDTLMSRILFRDIQKESGEYDAMSADEKARFNAASKDDLAAVVDARNEMKAAQKRMNDVAAEEQAVYTELKRYRKGIPTEEEQRFARGVEVSSPDLTGDQVRMLQKNDLVGALRSISEDKNNTQLNRAVAARLASLLGATDVKLVKNLRDEKGEPALGRATSKLVELDASLGVSQEILLHEATHAAVERVLQLPESQLTDSQRIARKELEALFNAVKNDPRITSANAKGSLSEFAAEVMSNSNLQKQLSQKKWRLADAWQGFKSIVMRMLGIEKPETMLGAALQSVDALMIPSSAKVGTGGRPKRVLSQKDIAALHTGSNSMRQFAEQFGPQIKQKDRTPEDAERIANEYIIDINSDPAKYLPIVEGSKLDYMSSLRMSDGQLFDPDNLAHMAEATAETLAAYKASQNESLRNDEARKINQRRFYDLEALVIDGLNNPAYTLVEQALVLKAASKYAVVAGKNGRLELANISDNNRHQIAVVGHDAANAVIEELRAGKGLKQAFLDGMQRMADANAVNNQSLNGWKKFAQSDVEADGVALNAGAAGTVWCTGASVSTARTQLEQGDFYIYYKNGRPEVAVRMTGDTRIGEVRGNTSNQSLNTEQQQIAEQFLKAQKTFTGAAKYLGEMERKRALVAYFKLPSQETLRPVIAAARREALGSDIDAATVRRMFDFSSLDGYALRRPTIQDVVAERFAEKLNEGLLADIKEGYLAGINAKYSSEENAVSVTVSGKEKVLVSADKVKNIGRLSISTSNLRDKVSFPVLETAEAVEFSPYDADTELAFPKLKSVGEVVWNGRFNDSGAINMPPTAKVGVVKPGYVKSGGVLTINGMTQADTVKLFDGTNDFSKRPTFSSFAAFSLSAPDLLYAEVVPVTQAFYFGSAVTAASKDVDYFSRKDKVNGPFVSARSFAIATPEELQTLEKNIDRVYDVFRKALGGLPSLKTGKEIIEYVKNDLGYDIDTDEITGRFPSLQGYVAAALGNAIAKKYADKLDIDAAIAINKKINAEIKKPAYRNVDENGFLYLDGRLPTDKFTFEAPKLVGDKPPATEAELQVEDYQQPQEQPRYAKLNPELRGAMNVAEAMIKQERPVMQRVREANAGLSFETYVVDRFAGFERLRKYMPQFKGMQMAYYLRMYDQRMNFVSQSAINGALDLVAKKRKDGETEYVLESVKGPSIKSTVEILKRAKPMVGDPNAVNQLFTMYMTSLRADDVGFDKLGLEGLITKQSLAQAMADINRVPGLKDVFNEARNEYNTYNKNQITFLEKTGAITKKVADELRTKKDYIPWYRANRDGGVEFVLGDEGVFTVGNVKDKPYLHELVGDNRPIFDFLTSSVQNTNMIVDMGLNNMATKNAVFELVDIGAARITGKISGPDVVRFKDKGEDKYAVIETDRFGVPAELLVKGMEGIPMQVTGLMRLASLPSKFLRKAVTLNPLYPARQLFRDSLAAPIISGADFMPVMGALRQIGSVDKDTLERRGIVGGQYFTGTQEDLSMILREVIDGKSGVATLISKAEAIGMEADALTRRAQYQSYIKQGLSDMEATLMSLESMNFNKRGAASYMHTANALIPFLNAQIQSLNVLYKSLRGQMPLNDKLKTREKLLTRGTALMAGTLAYAVLMEDDEAYKNALPEQKYGNWFIRLPGVEEPLKLPIPFEIGYIFKAMPEALYNMIKTGDSDEAKAALNMILRQVTPGGSSMPVMDIGGFKLPVPLPIPQFAKPALETALGVSFYTGRDILSAKEQRLLPEAQYRENTTELMKMFGGATGMSPIKMDALVNGYTSALGIAVLHLFGLALPESDSPEKATKRLSEMPIVSGAFQPNDAGWAINRTYDMLKEDVQFKNTVNDYFARGEKAKAMEMLQKNADRLLMADLGNHFEQDMRKLTQYETAIKALDISAEEKRQRLDEVRQIKIRYAEMVRQQSKAAKQTMGS